MLVIASLKLFAESREAEAGEKRLLHYRKHQLLVNRRNLGPESQVAAAFETALSAVSPAAHYPSRLTRFSCHLPRVKSGNFTGMLPCATDWKLSGPGALQAAAS